MNRTESIKRYLLLFVSLFFIGMGIAFTKYAGLGISPISSVANVVSLKYTSLSFGSWLTVSNCFLIFVQILLQRRKFRPVWFLELPMSFLSGCFADFWLWVLLSFPNDTYFLKLLLIVCGSVILGLGITMSIIANVVLNPGEAFVKALSDTVKKDFGNTKIVFDICWVALAAILSITFFEGKLVGIREGTVISAFLVGIAVKILRTILQKPLTQLLEGERQ